MSHRSRSVRAAATVAVAALALTGCAHEPGTAFSVGGTTVTRTRVDHTVEAVCRSLPEQAKAQGQTVQAVPRALAVSGIVSQLLSATVATAYGDSVGATYDGAALSKQTSSARQQARSLPSAERDAYVDFITDSVKGDLILVSIGRKALATKGATDQPSDDEARSVGQSLALRWARKQGISIDPRYSVSDDVRDGTPSYLAGTGDGSLSAAISSFARSSADAPRAGRDQSVKLSPSYVSGLPRDQRCGG